MKTIRALGDIHGNTKALKEAFDVGGFDTLVQLGDFGFSSDLLALHKYPSDIVRVLGGNHDEYPFLVKYPHYLGDYGILPGSYDRAFFVRGAYSIDKVNREKDVSWWEQEEIRYDDMRLAEEFYLKMKPDIVLSHDAPDHITRRWSNKQYYSSTRSMLSHMFEMYKPKLWVFGHHHRHEAHTVDGCTFVCVGIDQYVDILLSENEEPEFWG